MDDSATAIKKETFHLWRLQTALDQVILLQAYIALNMTETELLLKSLNAIRISVLNKDIMVPK